MLPLLYSLAVLILLFLLWWVWSNRRHQKMRIELLDTAAPDSWLEVLHKNVRFYDVMPERHRKRLHGYMHLFLAEKSFEACGDLEEVTEEMRVTIAAQACVLLLNGRNGCYDKLRSILLYPDAYTRKGERYVGDGIFEDDDDQVILGESWESGSVVLSWASVLSGAENDEDGQNVVIHEFAHQLDQANGDADGAPVLADGGRYGSWSRTMKKAYARHVKRTREGRRTAIDSYGATNPAEFFAVTTETFFEKPKALSRRYPGVYRELKKFYELDPVTWRGRSYSDEK